MDVVAVTKYWRQQKARRTRRHHGKGKKASMTVGGSDYASKPKRGHQWRGHGVERRCALCGMAPPGKGKPGVGK